MKQENFVCGKIFFQKSKKNCGIFFHFKKRNEYKKQNEKKQKIFLCISCITCIFIAPKMNKKQKQVWCNTAHDGTKTKNDITMNENMWTKKKRKEFL